MGRAPRRRWSIAHIPLLSCRVRWTPNALVFWDNRCVQHHAVRECFPNGRHGRMIAIDGQRHET
ncbi:TauD/TfdA family dioxygenase [Streptomyces sp. I05A-00742]|uniref:TauD/TfdA family dioxygenase n=1 Tax=Streptomyces sp. I05A-00742 TaxID=2732853 RepID=UPI001488C439